MVYLPVWVVRVLEAILPQERIWRFYHCPARVVITGGPRWTTSPTLRRTNRHRTPQYSTPDKPCTFELTQTRLNRMVQAIPLNHSLAASKTSPTHTPRIRLIRTTTLMYLGIETASMESHITTPMTQSVRPQPWLLFPSSHHHQAARLHRQPHRLLLLEGTLLPGKAQQQRQQKQSSVERHQMERKIQRNVSDEDVDHCCQNNGNKPARSES